MKSLLLDDKLRALGWKTIVVADVDLHQEVRLKKARAIEFSDRHYRLRELQNHK